MKTPSESGNFNDIPLKMVTFKKVHILSSAGWPANYRIFIGTSNQCVTSCSRNPLMDFAWGF
jgi:hypothetical protein